MLEVIGECAMWVWVFGVTVLLGLHRRRMRMLEVDLRMLREAAARQLHTLEADVRMLRGDAPVLTEEACADLRGQLDHGCRKGGKVSSVSDVVLCLAILCLPAGLAGCAPASAGEHLAAAAEVHAQELLGVQAADRDAYVRLLDALSAVPGWLFGFIGGAAVIVGMLLIRMQRDRRRAADEEHLREWERAVNEAERRVWGGRQKSRRLDAGDLAEPPDYRVE